MLNQPFSSSRIRFIIYSFICLLNVADGGSNATLCKLPNDQNRQDVALGFPRISNRMRTTGKVNFSVLFVAFPDEPQERTPNETMTILEPAIGFYSDVSYGKMEPILSPLLQSFMMPENSTNYNIQDFYKQRKYLEESTTAALKVSDWDFSQSDSVIVMATPLAKLALPNGPAFTSLPGEGYNASGRVFENSATSGADFDYWKHLWANHELGHTMGLVDLYSYSGQGGEFSYTGQWSIMGNIVGAGGEYFAWERWLLNWLDDSNVQCAGSGISSVSLTALEQVSLGGLDDLRMATIRLNKTSAVCAEYRSAIGHDAAIPQPGVLVYLLNTALSSGEGVIRVLGSPESDPTMLTATLNSVGDSINFDSVAITLTEFSIGGNTATISISNPCRDAVNCFLPNKCVSGSCN
jgi:M6 family metalloprotease-like protein